MSGKVEVYSSFEGKLDVDQQEGYVLYLTENFIEYNWLSVWQDDQTSRARFPIGALPEESYGDRDKVWNLVAQCWDGTLPGGQIMYKGKWWSDTTIRKIQDAHQDMTWQKYAR